MHDPTEVADFDGDGQLDVLWHSRDNGKVTVWLLDGVTVTGTQELSWTCDWDSACSLVWRIAVSYPASRHVRVAIA